MVDDSAKAAADAEATFKTEVEKLQKAYVAPSPFVDDHVRTLDNTAPTL